MNLPILNPGEEKVLARLAEVAVDIECRARQYARAFRLDHEDLEQEGLLAACKRAAVYRPEFGIDFLGFAKRTIRGAMLDYALLTCRNVRFPTSSLEKAGWEVSIFEPVEDLGRLVGDNIPAWTPSAEELRRDRLFNQLESAMDQALTQHRELLQKRFVEGLTREQVAQAQNASEAAVRKTERQAIRKIRQAVILQEKAA